MDQNNPLFQKLEKLFTKVKETIESADDSKISPDDRKLIHLLEGKMVD